MKNKDLIKRLQKLPEDLEVCIFDIDLNADNATDEPTSEGIYSDFEVGKVMTEKELKSVQKDYPKTKNWIALTYVSSQQED